MTISLQLLEVKDLYNSRLYQALLNLIIWDKMIKVIEYGRGLYRYPKKMLGRKIPSIIEEADILVIAAHPDDEILGLNTTLLRQREKSAKVTVVYTTNGTGGSSWKKRETNLELISNKRFKEGKTALAQIDISSLICLGYPDSGSHRYLINMSKDIEWVLHKINPKKIYVHCTEGGHGDHDMTGFVVKSVCKLWGYSNLFEWTEYNPAQPFGTEKVSFLPSIYPMNKEEQINISAKEHKIKKKLLAVHESQNIERFHMMGEAIRKASLSNIEEQLYEHSLFPSRRLKKLVDEYYRHIQGKKYLNSSTVEKKI